MARPSPRHDAHAASDERASVIPMLQPENHSAPLDPHAAETAWRRYADAWSRATVDARPPGVAVDYVVSRVLQIAATWQQPAMRARLTRLPEFDIAHLDALSTVCWAIWHCRRQQGATPTHTPRLPEELRSDANALRTEMLRVVRYHVDETSVTPSIQHHLDAVRIVGTPGALRLSQDLTHLAALYRDASLAASYAQDRVRYVAADADTAQRYAGEILLALDRRDAEVTDWTQQIAAGWSALTAHYAEVRRAVRYLEGDRDGGTSVPPLTTMRPPTRRAAKATKPAAKPDAPKPA